MALAKERTHYGAFYGENGLLGLEGDHECVNGILRNFSVGHLPHLTDSCSENRVINFKGGSNNSAHCYASLLNFEQGDRASKVRNAVDDSYTWNQINPNRANESRHSEDLNCFEATSSSGYRSGKDNQVVDEEIGWLYSDGGAIDGFEESTVPEANSQKRPHMGNEIEYRKKQRLVEGSRKPKPKTITAKDPQSIAAKNRRERISERLKILQDLVPNGSKVDLVTMLEKAISYVKFLQLQVKVLATDEFWPAQGGKAPEISQVKEAIDAILSSQGDRTTSSN